MAPRSDLRVDGYKQFVKAISHAPKDVKREVRTVFRQVGEHVRADAERAFSSYGVSSSRASHAESAAGYRVVVRQRGVEVDSRKRKTTGQHPEYGDAQMRHGLLPGVKKNEPRLLARMEAAMDEVTSIIDKRSL